jgi:type II secretory pathway pseudopilin PulG
MCTRGREEAGDTLVEVIIALIIIGVVVSSFFASIATTATASKTQRDFVTADAALRDYAEAAKQAARDTCTSSNTGQAFTVSYTPPAGSGISVVGAGQTCPSPTSVNTVTITATLLNNVQRSLKINVRTP